MKTKLQLAMLVLTILIAPLAFSQNNCTLVGWASQNGGVTGGGSATPTVVTNYAALKSAIENETVKVVHISGTITFPSAGRINFQDQTGKTIYGLPGSKLVSSDRSASGSGIFYVKRLSNIIFRNITFEGPGAYDTDGNDNMTIDNCTNVWVDHCDFQDGVDGNLDIKNLADYISITWCRFVYFKPPIAGGSGGADDHRFSNLFGSSDGATGDRGKLRITMQNCWWAQGCKERMPRVRFGKVHIVNNYFSSAGNNHCIRAGFEADLRIESNYFENVNLPIDLFENDAKAVSSINNLFVNTTGNTTGSGTAFTPPYSLTVTPAANVKSQVTGGAGATLTSANCAGGGGTTTFALTTTSSPAAGGSVSGAGSYASGSTATVTATPAAGYTFTGWSGAASGTANPLSVTMNANKTVTANFSQNPATTYTLTTTASPAAGGSVTRNPNATAYASGTVVSLTATPAAGYTFTGWSGGASGTTNPLNVTITANTTVTANFSQSPATTYTLTTTASPAAGGTITRNPNAASYASGTVVTLTATPAAGYTFSGFSGDASGSSATTTVTMSANRSVNASFQQTPAGNAQIVYVSPTGSASSPGTNISSPTTLQNAIATIGAGGTIFMRGGTYAFSATILIPETNAGTSGNTKKIFAYNGEVPVINFSSMALSTSNRGVILDGSYWHLRGIIVEGAGDNGLLLSGDNNIIESCIFRKNRDTGLQLSRYNTSYNTIALWPSNNLILTCEAYDNADPDAEDADGFAAKLTSGNGNVFRNCVSHHNIDDGWDLYTKSDTGPIGAITLEGCIAHSNGTLTTGGTSGNGDKNGFKLGGEDIKVDHIVRRCIAFSNGKHGFTYNRNLGTIEMTNNTAYQNAERNFNFDGGTSIFKNNLSFLSASTDRIVGTSSAPNAFSGIASSFTITAADFVTLTRGVNASPVANGFLNLASGSDAINAGVTSSGITFNGFAPDLGALEFGGTTPVNYTLTTTALPVAGGTVSRSPNATSYAAGTVVTLTATPAAGYIFTGWSGGASGSDNPLSVTLNANTTITANFAVSNSTYTVTTTAAPAAGGNVSRSPNATSYAAGTVVSFTATPAAGYVFTGWSGGASGSDNPLSVTINANTTITANFAVSTNTFTLTTIASPSAGGTILRSINGASYSSGTVVSLTATPAIGYTFAGWSGDATGTLNPISVMMTANRTVTATFTFASTGNTTLRIDDKATAGTGYCGADGSRQNSYSGADGGYYINISNDSKKGVDWSVRAAVAGTYTLRWRYSNGGSQSATTARVFVNGAQAIASVAFPKTASWTTWVNTANVSVTLVAGTNKIRLETIASSEFAAIDWIEVTGNSPTEASCTATIGSRLPGQDAGPKFSPAPDKFEVFPNPVSSTSTIRFTNNKDQKVDVYLVGTDGRMVKSISSRVYAKGIHYIPVDCSSVKSSTYFIVVKGEDGTTQRKAVVVVH